MVNEPRPGNPNHWRYRPATDLPDTFVDIEPGKVTKMGLVRNRAFLGNTRQCAAAPDVSRAFAVWVGRSTPRQLSGASS
jgi:hypothetical protein